MIHISIETLIEVVDGKLLHKGKYKYIKGVCIDSRKVEDEFLFIPFKGQTTDGHKYMNIALDKGASACLTEQKINVDIENKEGSIILVKDTLIALHKLTKYYRSLLKLPIIGLTGSSGKTTTKDIISSVLSEKYKVIKTDGNKNNELGVPLTMFTIEDYHEVAVIEMGMRNLGEIRELVQMVQPDISLITNIGSTHIENLKTKDNIYRAKTEIFDTLRKDQLGIINGDDDFLQNFNTEKFKLIKIGINNNNLTYKANNIKSYSKGISFQLNNEDEVEEYYFTLPGTHNIYNCLMAVVVAKQLSLNKQQIQKGFDNYMPSNDRMDIKFVDNITIINDSYNANPDSMKAAIDTLYDYAEKGRTIAILGDMLEMGEKSSKYHQEIGTYINNTKIDILVSVGELGKDYIDGATKAGMKIENCYYFSDNNQLINNIKDIIESNDTILIKGSRGMKMEEIANFLLERS